MDTVGAAKKSLSETFNMIRLRQLNNLREEDELCDLTLKCQDGSEIRLHRVLVLSSCNYFKNLLSISKNKKSKSISLPGITGDVLEKIITFIYTSEFDEEIEDVEKIIKYAAMFEQLVEICSLALSESMTEHSCLKYWRFAGYNLISSLGDKCLSYIASNADHLFGNLLMSDLTVEEMRSLLSDTRLHLQCEEKKIFQHVWKWSERKVSETHQVFSELISKLEFEFICQKLVYNEEILSNAELLKKVAKLTKQKFSGEVASGHIFYKPTQRLIGLASKKMYIGFGEENTIEKEINLRSNSGYTTFDNKLLICGGKIEDSVSNSCESFEPSTQRWKEFPSMKSERFFHKCSYLDNKIYACGGYSDKSVEIFDFEKEEWNYGPEMLAENWDYGLTAVNGALYAIGGETNYVTNLDPRTQKWNAICSSIINIYYPMRCVSIGPRIYCFTNEKRIIFDTRSNKFIEEIDFGDFVSCFSYCYLDGYLYGLGYVIHNLDDLSLNLIHYHLNVKGGFNKCYGKYESSGLTETAIVSLYY